MSAASGLLLMVVVLLLPTALAVIADAQPGRPCARAVLLFGLAASWPRCAAVWHGGAVLGAAVPDIRAIAWAWSAQACGWLLTQSLPFLIRIASDVDAQRRASQLHRRQTEIRQEWFEETSAPGPG